MLDPNPKADLTSVRSLVTSVTALSKALKVAPGSVYRWIAVNRIPGAHLVKVANFYNVELRDLLPLTGSEIANKTTLVLKPRAVLAALLEVYKGKMTLAEATKETGASKISLKLIMTHWGDELPTLYTTLEQLDQGRITPNEAAQRLRVGKSTLFGIRRKYGYSPGPVKRVRPLSTLEKRREQNSKAAMQCIAGRTTVREAAHQYKISQRTVFRVIDELSPIGLITLNRWPKALREVYAVEIEAKTTQYAEKWYQFCVDSRIFVDKALDYPETPGSWRNLPLKRLLVGVLMGEGTLEEIAASRGADPAILRNLFTGDLRPLGLTYDDIEGMSMKHLVALSEILLALMDRRRKVVE